MRNGFGRLLAALALVLGSSGCVHRYVTETFWRGSDTLYVAYSDSSVKGSRVEKCSRSPDNKLTCAEQPALNDVLAK